ncbi:MAG: DUF4124 domain-containing protein [Caldimonas sp.]
MVRPFAALLVLLAAALVALPAQAQWKWKDKAGHVQYSDLPPPVGTPDADILNRPNVTAKKGAAAAPFYIPSAASATVAAAAASSALMPRTVDPELEAKKKKAEAEQAAKTKVEEERVAAARAETCKNARAQLQTLESGIRIARSNASGEREYLDDKQRADETKRTRDAITGSCN